MLFSFPLVNSVNSIAKASGSMFFYDLTKPIMYVCVALCSAVFAELNPGVVEYGTYLYSVPR